MEKARFTEIRLQDQLIKDRVFESRNKLVKDCPRCHGSGFVDKIVLDTNRRVYCKCMKHFFLEKNLILSGVPLEALELQAKIKSGRGLVDVEYRRVILDVNEHNITEINKRKTYYVYRDLLMPYVENSEEAINRGDSILVFGSNSRGKTWSLYYIALSLMDKYSVLFLTLKELFIYINAAYYGSDNNRDAAVSKAYAQSMLSLIKDVDILLLDEGSKVPKFSDSVSVQLEGITKDRIGNNKSVVLATNHAPLDFHRHFGPQVVSAFIKGVYCIHILTGPDLRHQAMRKSGAFSYVGKGS